MHKASLRARLRARLGRDERGFTIIETVIAITVIFASLTAMAYTSTMGFKYIGFSRQRIQATSVASEVMEKVRALPYATLTSGMSTNDPTFSTDTTNIKTCSGVYRFQSCTLGTDGTGEKIVYGTGAAGSVSYLINHRGSVTAGGTTFSWSTYVTNENSASSPYRVTVIVSWSGSLIATASVNSIKVQSLFWSPNGCISSNTHPFAAPCQGFFYGKAEVPVSTISMTGTVSGLDVSSGEIALPGATVTAQQEQVTNLTGTVRTSGLSIDSSSGPSTSGGVITAYQADDDVTSSTASVGGGSPAGATPPLSSGIQLQAAAGGTSDVGLSTSASSSDARACPPSGVRMNNALPCAGAQVTSSGPITATVPLSQVNGNLGSMVAVRVQAPATASTVLANRTTVSGYDGLMTTSVSRSLGTIQIGGFPSSGMTAPTGMSTNNTLDTNYCVRLVDYRDTASGSAGPFTATVPASAIDTTSTRSKFWYLSAGTFTSMVATNSMLSGLAVTCDSGNQNVGTQTVRWLVTVNAGGLIPASAPPATCAPTCASTTRTEITASTTPFDLTCTYQLFVDGTKKVNLTIGLDLGQLSANAVYGPPPTAG